jgi:hypothetical protein
MKNFFFKSLVAALLLSLSEISSYALSVETHETINVYIAQKTLNGFSLDTYLKEKLKFENGYDEKFNNLEVWKRIRDGGRFEDKPPVTWTPSTWFPYNAESQRI